MEINGNIIDGQTGRSVEGAIITLLNENRGYTGQSTISDTNGNFSITTDLLNPVLNISYLGYANSIINARSFMPNVPLYPSTGIMTNIKNGFRSTFISPNSVSKRKRIIIDSLLLGTSAFFVIFIVKELKKKLK